MAWVAIGIAMPGAMPTVRADPLHAPPRPVAAQHVVCSGTPIAGSGVATRVEGPEIATGFASRSAVTTATVMAVTANPLASRAACETLARGGSAIDAAVAAQMVLNVVEPQSSGLGGGAFLLYYDATTKSVDAYDGRETAPAAATANDLRYVDDAGDRTGPRPSARASGRSIGVPGALRMLELAHRDHGRLPWATLLEPGLAIARRGFAISPRMAASIDAEKARLARDVDARAYFLQPDGSAKPAGTTLKSPALAKTFETIARLGPDAFYNGPIAARIVAKARTGSDAVGEVTPSRLTVDDLARYRAKKRAPVCTLYRTYVVCGVGPPSSGGIAVASTLGILERFDLSPLRPDPPDRDGGRPNPAGVHLIAEAERLAYADRDRYVADTDFVALPGGSPAALLDPAYLASRAWLIDPARSMGRAEAGRFGDATPGVVPVDEHGTTQLVIADAAGDVATMTTTVESAFGSFHFVDGFVLNNQLTDFAASPTDPAGRPVANRVAPGKRPRSSMAPTLVFRRNADGSRGAFVFATGSAGGQVIIQYVVKTLVGVLDWGLDPQQAVSMIDFGALNGPITYVGGEHPDVDATADGAADPLATGLRRLGHTVSVAPHSSGLAAIERVVVDGVPRWVGGVDPRREGVVVGDAVRR